MTGEIRFSDTSVTHQLLLRGGLWNIGEQGWIIYSRLNTIGGEREKRRRYTHQCTDYTKGPNRGIDLVGSFE